MPRRAIPTRSKRDQDIRARDSLTKLLEAFIAKEQCKWVKTFPAEFYKEMFRLRKWTFSEAGTAKPALVGHLTNDLVYSRLAPGVLDELRRVTPRDDKGRLKTHLHRSSRRISAIRDFGSIYRLSLL